MKFQTKRALIVGCLMVCLGLMVGAAQAGVLLVSDIGYTGPFLDLSAQANGSYNFTFGPVALPGGITFTAAPGDGITWPIGGNSGNGSVLGQGPYALAANGSFNLPSVYAGVDSGAGNMTFSLSAPVSQFGLYLNYAPGVGNPPIIETLDNLGNPISAFDLSIAAPISTPGGFNQFEFRGIDEGANTIWGLRLGGSYLLAAATATGAPTPTPTPEPASIALFGLGLIGLGAFRRSKA